MGRTPSRELGGGVGDKDMETTPSGNVAKKERCLCISQKGIWDQKRNYFGSGASLSMMTD